MLRRSNYLKILCTSALLALSTLAMAQDKPASVLITNVMVWDGTSEERVAADILIEDNIITQVACTRTFAFRKECWSVVMPMTRWPWVHVHMCP
jgi:hypothetical protein